MMMLSLIIALGALISVAILVAITLLSKFNALTLEMLSPFECGFDTKLSSRYFFSLQFFLVTLVFLIFDIELVLIFPILLMKSEMGFLSLAVFFLLITLLSLGLFWEWNQTMLDWKK